MDIRYSANQRDFKRYTTDEIRNEFLIENLYEPDSVVAVYSHADRMVTLGCMPVNEVVPIDKGIDVWSNFGTNYFLERREIGIFNIGGEGEIVADDETFKLDYKDCLYITKGTKNVTFKSLDKSNPAKFYMVSAPAHIAYKTTFISINRSEEHTSELQSHYDLVCRLLLEKKKIEMKKNYSSQFQKMFGKIYL